MPFITLTTDLGNADYYAGAVKGAILKRYPQATLVDITHEVTAFDIAQGAFIVKNCYREFPEGTIHLIGVGSTDPGNTRALLARANGHYLIAHDNGILSLILDDKPEQLFEILLTEEEKNDAFIVKSAFCRVACHLAAGNKPEAVCVPTGSFVSKQLVQPALRNNHIHGAIMYIDHYNNIITNIAKKLFEEAGKGRPFLVHYSTRDSIDRISRHYNEVPESEVLCLFGSSGYLEIALNKAHAGSLLGLRTGDQIMVQFL